MEIQRREREGEIERGESKAESYHLSVLEKQSMVTGIEREGDAAPAFASQRRRRAKSSLRKFQFSTLSLSQLSNIGHVEGKKKAEISTINSKYDVLENQNDGKGKINKNKYFISLICLVLELTIKYDTNMGRAKLFYTYFSHIIFFRFYVYKLRKIDNQGSIILVLQYTYISITA